MSRTYRTGATGALLDEYEKAVNELINTIADISDAALTKIVDPHTDNPDCRSVQTILAHVVSSMYSYAVYIRQHKGVNAERPQKVLRESAALYITALQDAFTYNIDTFALLQDHELEQAENEKKILTRWGQLYDMGQLAEHAIVHVLRHRRQIARFKEIIALQKNPS
ncbi:DinB family protein [Chitinophaga vietnamensis]|uniref:DinB family protein n=1 Tax=Chitinophaga vietnamensis TaxID=2593957 RepID=UPI0011777738|nr:DinB family protein [Chitinophaga vietnamensis]